MFNRIPIMNRFRPSSRLIAAAASLAILAATAYGCKPGAEAPKPPPGAEVKKVALGPDEPTKALPPDMFKNMPLFPGATVEHVRRPKGAMREILFSSTGQMSDIVAFYKDQLKKSGFTVTSSLIMPARRTWSCDFHQNGRPASIMLYPSDADKSKMTIDLIYEMPAKVDSSMMAERETFDVIGPGAVGQPAQNPNEKTKRN